jgi:hypothetical protein
MLCLVLSCAGDADEDALCGLGLDFNLGMDDFDLELAEPDVKKAPEKAPTKSGKPAGSWLLICMGERCGCTWH